MMFDNRRIVSAAGEDVVKIYDKLDGRHWDCGSGVTAEEDGRTPAIVERVRIKDGYVFLFLCEAFPFEAELIRDCRYLTEGRRDGKVGIWTS
jgi:mitochondrial division protein 1